ncbi:MAG: hypothetical protein DRG58_04785 [Deltaproteobacteria bacterium]|nr:MAG: hypothetical protein DRG58_04785 [Deltaproteobacteria bacterium]
MQFSLPRPLRAVSMILGIGALLLLQAPPVYGFSTNLNHELGLYSLKEYGQYGGVSWKSNLANPDYYTPSIYLCDPAGVFWDLMTVGASSEYAHSTSRKRENSRVNIHTIFPIAGDGWKDWDQFDLVFFYGHNNMITPPHPCYSSHFWSNGSGSWAEVTGGMCDWGTSALPYEYYYQDITAGRSSPGAVVYLHEPFTSALLGWHFIPGTDSVVQTVGQDTAAGNSPATTITCRSGLGTNDLEWLILHGCQAVIVANSAGTSYHPMGATAFSLTWDGFHIVMGHYRSYGVGALNDLTDMANHLLAGDEVQAAYFLTFPRNNLSAISAENCGDIDPEHDPVALNNFLINDSFMNNDTWTNPKPDLSGDPNLWYIKWIREDGTDAEDWRETTCGRFAKASHPSQASGKPQNYQLNLTDYQIKDPAVQKALGVKTIPIRAATYKLRDQELPILQIQEVSEDQARAQLHQIIGQFGAGQEEQKPEADKGHMFAAQAGTRVFWVAKASGAASFSETQGSMAIPTTISNHRQAVALALKQVVDEKLVEPGPHETLDVMFVSQVTNAVVKDPKQKETTRQYPADYFVGIGRRYNGVPVIGSRLVLRLGADGRLFGMQKNWRPIIGKQGHVSIKEADLMPQLQAELEAQKVLKPGQTVAKDIKILGMACGYLEGPTIFEQKLMGPGCLINYRPAKRSSEADLVQQIVIPLAKVDFPLLGSRKQYPPPETQPPVTDTDDKVPDESK